MAVGIPSWIVLLAAFNENLTGIPWVAGFAMASVLATAITVITDRRAFRGGRRLGPFGRFLLIWAPVFVVLGFVVASGGQGGAGVLLIPLIGASVVAGGAELARRALGRS